MKTFRYLIAGLLLLAALPSQSKEEEISVSRSWGKLSGTLTVPDEGSDAAVLIIAGSGPTDRNGNSGSGLTTNTYYMLARALEKEGIASLRYDKQGIGGSRYQDPELYKQEDRLRLADYIADAEALTDYLKERGFRKIILAGHSEGSLIALVAATESPDIAAVISLAGAGYPIDEILQFQLTRELISYNPGLILNVQSILSRLKQGKNDRRYSRDFTRYLPTFRTALPDLVDAIRSARSDPAGKTAGPDRQWRQRHPDIRRQCRSSGPSPARRRQSHHRRDDPPAETERSDRSATAKNDYLYGCCRACFRKVSDGHGGFHPPDMTFCRHGETSAPPRGFRAIACRPGDNHLFDDRDRKMPRQYELPHF